MQRGIEEIAFGVLMPDTALATATGQEGHANQIKLRCYEYADNFSGVNRITTFDSLDETLRVLVHSCFLLRCTGRLFYHGAIGRVSLDQTMFPPRVVSASARMKPCIKYMNATPEDGPTTLSIATHSSPWHLYDGDYRILEIEEVAAMVRQQGSKIKRVILVASWSGLAPDPHSKSLAQKLSEALGGSPVTGQNGFVWVSPKSALHTTHQAFTGRVSGPYWVSQNEQVMASLVLGWAIDLEDQFAKAHDAAGLLQVGVAKDVFMLCPDGALQSYEDGAALNSPIAAFNAAIMRRGTSLEMRPLPSHYSSNRLPRATRKPRRS